MVALQLVHGPHQRVLEQGVQRVGVADQLALQCHGAVGAVRQPLSHLLDLRVQVGWQDDRQRFGLAEQPLGGLAELEQMRRVGP